MKEIKLSEAQLHIIRERAGIYAEAIRTSSARGVENFIKKYNYCPKRNHSNMFCRSSSSNTDNKTANELVEDKLQNKD